ncbi:polysaccharide deacetylase family protein [Wenyingzhuangia sp. 2_MG-2023]|uniref:polysaccharide deacetylase family protein n=1 Tax=Wenyingzhuangia sp. 2_MG-2023 TaxID=3062639 RepID=UPI0026E199CA|nr:polysaccharide deacetylase family protein [Wenyingzhuangia sp. 2_MG-2023]MDO6738829.1 polysaccharide deacetylase family protein [Wenyingzhuangia sp. 2_MG-2023]
MMCFKLLGLVFLGLVIQNCTAQTQGKWNGKECAVVLTYDDSLEEHLDNVIPSLNTYNLKGTFYIIGSSDCFKERNSEWKSAAKEGHELGNHTLMHPCANTPKRKKQLPPELDLNNYTLRKVVDEIAFTNDLLTKIDAKSERTFAFPCGQKNVNDTIFYDYVKKYFVGARGVKRGMKSMNEIDLEDINAYGMKEHTGQEMIALVDEAIKNKKLLVFLFHGVGGGSPLNVGIKEHQQLLEYLNLQKKKVWVAPMVDVALYIKQNHLIE